MIQTLLSSLSIVSWSYNTNENEDSQIGHPSESPFSEKCKSGSASLRWYACNHFGETSRLSNRMIKLGYVDSVAKEAKLSDAHLIAAMVYSERIEHADPTFLQSISSSDLFLIAILVASKFLYDEGEEDALLNSEWAKIGHRRQSTVNLLEREFLRALDWDVFVSKKEFDSIAGMISAKLALQHGLSSGWFSYADLTAIWLCWRKYHSHNLLTWDVLKSLLLCSMVYIAGISTLLATSWTAKTLCNSLQSPLSQSSHVLTTTEGPIYPLEQRKNCSADSGNSLITSSCSVVLVSLQSSTDSSFMSMNHSDSSVVKFYLPPARRVVSRDRRVLANKSDRSRQRAYIHNKPFVLAV